MIRINLLPFRAARRKENIRQQVSIFLLSLVFVTFVLIFIQINLSSKIKELTTNVNNTRKELVTYNKINAEINTIKRELANLNKKIDVIASLESSRKEPVRLLDAMTRIIVPKRMRFTSLVEKTTSESPEQTSKLLSIYGLALDNKTVADFMTRLETSQLFTSVNLMTLQQDKDATGLNLKSFKIDCNKAPLAKANDEKK